MHHLSPGRIHTSRLTLEPVSPEHATGMASALSDPELYAFIGGEPPSRDDLEDRYRRLESALSPDRTEGWLNWAIRATDDGQLAGYVQATVRERSGVLEADVAWVIGKDWQGRRYATEAADAIAAWLQARGVGRLSAWIRPGHAASEAVARRLHMIPTSEMADGEMRWVLNSG
ncbi:GNAT family N-acetyltransferase [Demequina capsici]|uniref:GNAT family N-acetyltransferase n=1 Tax=Demequina capsici TaxID=3075620 RepID=A0AA96JBE3_9MICO|nr:GNAT family N-acetyltransferase [Demequina sp. PMTSA13]WNM27973.1 GNAT family N-acetyltransferase [Demequina sp. PMTSA13]